MSDRPVTVASAEYLRTVSVAKACRALTDGWLRADEWVAWAHYTLASSGLSESATVAATELDVRLPDGTTEGLCVHPVGYAGVIAADLGCGC